MLAAWLVADGNNEVALARIAVERAQDPKVKQFAQMMVTEHGAMNQKLQPFAANAMSNNGMPGNTTGAGDRDSDLGSSGSTKEADGSANDSRTRDASGGMRHGGAGHLALIQELKMQCLESSRKELESKSGSDFDRCYMGMMIGEHMQANDMLTVFRKHVSGELEGVMADGQQHVAAHLAQAKALSKQLDGARDKVSGG